MPPSLRLATRGSALALAQSRWVAERLRQACPGLEIEILDLKTRGDLQLDQPLHALGGKGLFTKEIDRAVLDGAAHFAVHSLKDLPTETDPKLTIAAVPERAPSEDVLALPAAATVADLPSGAEIGCGSLRRQAQLRRLRPDLRFVELRGNVETRLERVRERKLAGTVLARAGLQRLGLQIPQLSLADVLLPAAGQGALALVCRADDAAVAGMLRRISDPQAEGETAAERAFLARLGAGCHAPTGIRSRLDGSRLRLEGAVFSADGRREARATLEGEAAAPLGTALAERLLAAGAGDLLT